MDELAERIAKKIVEEIHPDKVILFGSRARGEAGPESDVDLAVVYSGPKTKKDIRRQINRLFLDRDFSMDVFVITPDEMEKYRHVANTLAREVAERGVALYG
ncbi:MAG: nucleotidyltransferase domain-containing protein [Nitrospinae bacterium]|nr:nucleotidyltransferase domain-containing protein [Nitrospinota bacterium]MBF0634159.1 nucleotidyltransferase domain-containing protein [Nitrospinota bacterium]